MPAGRPRRTRFQVENDFDGKPLDAPALGVLRAVGGHAIRMRKMLPPQTASWNIYFDRSLSHRERDTLRAAGYRYVGNRWYRSEATVPVRPAAFLN